MQRVALHKEVVLKGALLEIDILFQHLLDGFSIDLKPVFDNVAQVHPLLLAHMVYAQGHLLQPACLFQQNIQVFLNRRIVFVDVILFEQVLEPAGKPCRCDGWVLEVMEDIIKDLHSLGLHQLSAEEKENLYFVLCIPFSLIQGIKSHEMGDLFFRVQGDVENGIDIVVCCKSFQAPGHIITVLGIHNQHVGRGDHFVGRGLVIASPSQYHLKSRFTADGKVLSDAMVARVIRISRFQNHVLKILRYGEKGTALNIDDVYKLGDDPIEDILHLHPASRTQLLKNLLDDGLLFFVEPIHGKDFLPGDHIAQPARHEFRHLNLHGIEGTILFEKIDLDNPYRVPFMGEEAGNRQRDGHN